MDPRARPRRPGAAAALPAVALALLATACEEASQPRSWPAGTVLAVDGEPIAAETIDAATEIFLPIHPEATASHLRRLAIAHHVLPLVVARLEAGGAREPALERARSAERALDAGEPAPEPGPEPLHGGHSRLGFVTWRRALDLEDGVWSEVLEEPGRFRLVRVLERFVEGPVLGRESFRVEVLDFPYLAPETGPAQIEQAFAGHRLTLVDPAWRSLVPERIQYAMGVHGD